MQHWSTQQAKQEFQKYWINKSHLELLFMCNYEFEAAEPVMKNFLFEKDNQELINWFLSTHKWNEERQEWQIKKYEPTPRYDRSDVYYEVTYGIKN